VSVRIPSPPPHVESETYDILPKVLLRASAHYGAMVWRENSGLYWAPTATGWRRVRASTPGCSDIVGLVALSVPRLHALGIPTIGAFLGVETKTLTGKARDSQLEFQSGVLDRGGIYTIAHCPADVDRALGRLVG
jgi:hypothetical protein